MTLAETIVKSNLKLQGYLNFERTEMYNKLLENTQKIISEDSSLFIKVAELLEMNY